MADLSKIEAWLQKEDDELLYEPDGDCNADFEVWAYRNIWLVESSPRAIGASEYMGEGVVYGAEPLRVDAMNMPIRESDD